MAKKDKGAAAATSNDEQEGAGAAGNTDTAATGDTVAAPTDEAAAAATVTESSDVSNDVVQNAGLQVVEPSLVDIIKGIGKRAQAAGDHVGHALMHDIEIRFGEIMVRLPQLEHELSEEVAAFVAKLKASL